MVGVLHRVKITPVRVHSYNGELRCDSVRVVGYRARCECGWQSPVRATVNAARHERKAHYEDAAVGVKGSSTV